jgi:hypothetical protein
MIETLTIIISIVTKLVLYNSKLVHQAANILLFTKISVYDKISSISSLFIYNQFDVYTNLNSLKSTINSEITSVNPLFVRIITIFLENSEILTVLLISLIDAANAKLLSRLANKNKKSNLKLITFYLFNPITICSCIKHQSASFYIFIILIIFKNVENFYVYYLCLLGILFQNEYFVFYLIIIIYSFNLSIWKTNKKLFFTFLGIISFFITSYYLYGDYFQILTSVLAKNDTYPNIGILWGILNETFLKFRNFSILISTLYNIIIGVIIVYLTLKLRDSCNKSLHNFDILESKILFSEEEINLIFFSLLYTYQLIGDWYPSEMNVIVTICLITQIYHKIKNVYLNFGVSKF